MATRELGDDRDAHPRRRERDPVWVLEPRRKWSSFGVRDVGSSRDLLYFLALRDIKVRYSQAALGVAWAVIQPLLMMVVFSFFLGRLAKVPSDGIPYPVFAFTGLLPWTYFANAVGTSTDSLVSSSNLVSKVYFPRLVIPLASLLAWLPDFVIGSAILVVLMLAYGIVPGAGILLLPVFFAFTFLAAASVGVWLSALNVAYRDVRYAVPFLLQLWLFATPVVYPARLVPGRYRLFLGLNPMAGAVEGFRSAFVGAHAPPWGLIGLSFATTAVLLAGGLYYFSRVERFFADVI